MAEKPHPRFHQSTAVRWPRWGAWGLIAVVSALLYVRYPGNSGFYLNPDPQGIEVHLQALEKVERGGTPYSMTDAVPYRFSPAVLAVSQIFTRDRHEVRFIWAMLTILALALTLALGSNYRTQRSLVLLVVGLLLAWKGILETLEHGQFEIFFMAIAVLAAAILRRSPFLSGFLIGALPWFKLPWVLLVLPFLILVERVASPKKWRLLVSGFLLAWFVWGAAIPSLLFGPERAKSLSQGWIGILKAQPYTAFMSDVNQSFWALALRWSSGTPLFALGWAAIFSGLLWGRFTARANRQSADALKDPAYSIWGWLSPWLLFVQLLDPLSWRWGSVFALGIPFAVSPQNEPFKNLSVRKRGLAVVVLILVLVQIQPVDLHSYGIVTCFWLTLLLMTL